MKERLFRFKQFSVSHSDSAMKVGTDGVMLGAWASVEPGDSVLDVGTGCGLIGLMLAQREAGRLTLVDIDALSAAEAGRNLAASPWANHGTVICTDFLQFDSGTARFDRIVSNPPFFANGALAPDGCRANARHELMLGIGSLIRHAAPMLAPGGTLSLIMPPDREADARFAAEVAGLHCRRSAELLTRPSAPPRRVLLEFSTEAPQGAECREYLAIGSEDYKTITSPFYL